MMIGMMASFSTFFFAIKKNPQPITARIVEMENAIASIRNLDKFLKATKNEMVQMNEAKVLLERDYLKSKELDKITQNQLLAISDALQQKSKWETFVNYFWGAIFGISTSIIGSIIYGKLWKRA